MGCARLFLHAMHVMPKRFSVVVVLWRVPVFHDVFLIASHVPCVWRCDCHACYLLVSEMAWVIARVTSPEHGSSFVVTQSRRSVAHA